MPHSYPEDSVQGRSADISAATIDQLSDAFQRDPVARLAQNAVTQTTADDVALSREKVMDINFSFSTLLDKWTATNQKRSGRCWMFAALNLLRVGAMEKMNLKNFEFSQNYTLFWGQSVRLLPGISPEGNDIRLLKVHQYTNFHNTKAT